MLHIGVFLFTLLSYALSRFNRLMLNSIAAVLAGTSELNIGANKTLVRSFLYIFVFARSEYWS